MLTRLTASRLRYWTVRADGTKPLILVREGLFSLVNLVEAHMVSMFRDDHGVPLQRVRKALSRLSTKWPSDQHPLLTKRFMTDGRDILTDIDGQLVSLVERGQLSFAAVVETYSQRVEWKGRLPQRFFPWTVNTLTLSELANQRKSVVTDPRVQFGRPVIDGTRVTTRAIKDLWDVGTDAEVIAEEFGVTQIQVQDAVRLEEMRKQSSKKAG